MDCRKKTIFNISYSNVFFFFATSSLMRYSVRTSYVLKHDKAESFKIVSHFLLPESLSVLQQLLFSGKKWPCWYVRLQIFSVIPIVVSSHAIPTFGPAVNLAIPHVGLSVCPYKVDKQTYRLQVCNNPLRGRRRKMTWRRRKGGYKIFVTDNICCVAYSRDANDVCSQNRNIIHCS